MIIWETNAKGIVCVKVKTLCFNVSIKLCLETDRNVINVIHSLIIDAINSHEESIKLIPLTSKTESGYIYFVVQKVPHKQLWLIKFLVRNLENLDQRDIASTVVNHEQLIQFANSAPTTSDHIKEYEK